MIVINSTLIMQFLFLVWENYVVVSSHLNECSIAVLVALLSHSPSSIHESDILLPIS